MRVKRKEPMVRWASKRMKELRLRYGESQEAFCRRFPCSHSRYAAWEQGQDSPSAMAQTILDYLERDLKENRVRELVG